MWKDRLLYGRSDGVQGISQTCHEEKLYINIFFSPQDQAILEAEYEKNSKPDKAARAEIVKRVALGEKEVQVSKVD